MTKTIIEVDFANINVSANEVGITLDYEDLLHYLSYNYNVLESVVHLGVNPRNSSDTEDLTEYLCTAGWAVKEKMGTVAGKSFKANVDSEIVVDSMHHRFINKIDMLILCSGDGDFIPLVRYLRNYAGVYVCVAAFKHSCSSQLILEANSFIDMEVYYEDFKERRIKEDGVDNQEENVVDADYIIQ